MSTRRNRWLAATGLVLGLALALCLLLEPVDLARGHHGPDGRNYLSLLHSFLFDQDLLLYNDHAMLDLRIIVTPTGHALELHNIGTAFAFLSFCSMGRVTCLLLGGSCSGIDLSTSAWLSLGSWAYGLVALILMACLARTILSGRRAVVTVAALGLGSPFFYYWTRFFNPHMPAVMLVALLVLVRDWSRHRRLAHHWLLMGALVGLAATVASYHVVFLLLPGWDLMQALISRRSSAARSGPIAGGALLGLGALAGFAPRLIAWRLLVGGLLGTPYGRQLFWLQPGLPNVLISSYHGLYIYAPLLLLATAGIVPLVRQSPRRALPIAATFAAHIYVSSCSIAWWGGASVGARYLVSSVPLLVLPLAELPSRRRWRLILALFMGVCLLWTYDLLLADFGGLVDPGQHLPLGWLLRAQWEVLRALPGLVVGHLFTARFEAAPIYALPFALVLAALALAARRAGERPGWLAAAATVVLPLAVASLMALSDGSSQREIARLGIAERAEYPRGTYDLYDLSEGYWQRGAHRFVRGDLDRAREDFATARQIRLDRAWVRFHEAGRRHVPNPLEEHVDGRLALIGWEAAPESVTLYWQTSAQVLEPSYRTVLVLADRLGHEVDTHYLGRPDDWRALANEIVRVTYPLTWSPAGGAVSLHTSLHPAGAPDALADIQVALD